MPIQNLRQWIALLEHNNELRRVKAAVSSELEITEITDRVSKGPAETNKALLFENVHGFSLPVLINSFGSAQRMAWALGVDELDDLNRKLSRLLDLRLPKGLGESLARGADLFKALQSTGLKPKRVRHAPCQEIISTTDADLTSLPILKCWPQDGGRFITLPQVITRDPVTGIRNVGMYRLQEVDAKTLLVHWQRHKGGAEHERKARQAGSQPIPAAIALGGDPASIWCASAPLPPDLDEYMLAGYLRGEPVSFVRCFTQPLEVPAEAEIIIEGVIDPSDQRLEGPFGDHTGYYTPVEYFPAFHVTAITRRRDAIYPATVVGIPPMEDAWMGKATERLFLPLVRIFLPEVVDLCMPPAGVFHNLVLVSIKKRYPGHARKVIHALWGLGLLMLARAIVVVDDWVDVQNMNITAWQALGNVDWRRDCIIIEGSVDHLDHAATNHSFGGKIGIDATAKLPEEGYTRTWPLPVQMDADTRVHIDALWQSLKLDRP